jgi:hypothetical protein
MPLVDLKTNLKSIKYGLDRPNMGSSKEPFITKPIPDERPVDIPDFILRDGALRRGFEDVSRLTQLFTTVRGLRFIANTNLLAAQNPKIPGAPRNLYLPTSTIAQVGVNAIGTHLNLLGETPIDLPSTPINIGNFSFNIGGNTYYTEYKNNFSQPEDNRLVILSRKKIGLEKDSGSKFSKILRVNDLNATKYGIALFNDRLISNYLGGPGAGITGLNTSINRTEFTVGSKGYSGEKISISKDNSKDQIVNSITGLNLFNLLGATTQYFSRSGEKISGIEVPKPNEEITGINDGDGSQSKTFGPQSNNNTLSTLSKSSQLIDKSLEFSRNESNNSKTSLNLTNLLGASSEYFTYTEISGIQVPDPDPEFLGINPEDGSQLKTYGPQDNNSTLSTDPNKDSLISSSLQVSSNTTSLKTLSHYTNLLGVSKVYDGGQDRPDAPFSQPGEDKSGFNEENQQLKRYGPLDQNKLNDGHGDKYRYEWTPSKREDKNASLYQIGRQGEVDMFADPNTKKQTFFPNYRVINSPFLGEENFNQVRNQRDLFNTENTRKLNTAPISSSPPFSDQLYPFALNLINANNPGNNQYLYWQAYVESFSDSINSSYDEYNYVGYGTSFYKYKSFGRSIKLDFTIEVPHHNQMKAIYSKLQNLIRHLAPNYSGAGYLRGNFVKLTFGSYLRDTPCILKGFSIEPIFDGGFDIGRTGYGSRGQSSGYKLPKVIKVSGFDFTVIADNNNKLIDGSSTFISNKDKPLS